MAIFREGLGATTVSWFPCVSSILVELEFKYVGVRGGRKLEHQRKTLEARWEPTPNSTHILHWVRINPDHTVGGKRSDHCAIPGAQQSNHVLMYLECLPVRIIWPWKLQSSPSLCFCVKFKRDWGSLSASETSQQPGLSYVHPNMNRICKQQQQQQDILCCTQ